MRANGDHRGFTLLELVVVVVVIGVIAAIAVPRTARAVQAARESACRATLRTYLLAIESYEANHGVFPPAVTPALLERDELPPNPFGGAERNPVTTDATGDAALLHPAQKWFRTDNPTAKTFWYNPANGVFRALVPNTGDPASDLGVYVWVNGLAPPAKIEADVNGPMLPADGKGMGVIVGPE